MRPFQTSKSHTHDLNSDNSLGSQSILFPQGIRIIVNIKKDEDEFRKEAITFIGLKGDIIAKSHPLQVVRHN